MRCPSCNKFVSYDEPEVQVEDVTVEGTTVTADVTVNLNCADCGENLKSANIQADGEIAHECKPEKERLEEWEPDANYKKGEDDDQFEVEEQGDGEGTSRLETTDRHGKPIKSARYMKTFYGFTLESTIKCRACGETFPITLEGEEQASAFDENC